MPRMSRLDLRVRQCVRIMFAGDVVIGAVLHCISPTRPLTSSVATGLPLEVARAQTELQRRQEEDIRKRAEQADLKKLEARFPRN